MSKISIEGNASGTGTLTIAAPNTNTNRTLTLPDNTGTIITSGTTTGIDASALSTGTVAAARLPAGTVLQVVQATFTDLQQTTTSTSYVDTSVTASITPASASNKVLVLITSQCFPDTTAYVAFGIKRNSTDIANGINYSGGDQWLPVSISYLDSPNSTSSVSYTLRFKSSGGTVYNGWGSSTGGSTQNIVLMEIAG